MAYMEEHKFDMERSALNYKQEAYNDSWLIVSSLGHECKLSQEPASEDFEQEWKRYCDSKGGGAATMNAKDAAKHFAQWQKKGDESDDDLYAIHFEKRKIRDNE